MVRQATYLAYLAVAAVLVGRPARAQRSGVEDVPLIGGFVDHLVAVEDGRIDWSNGYILAEGVGYAQGTDKQQELLAERAATVVAARNALALAKGLQLDAGQAVCDMEEGLVRLEGVIKGHKIIESRWDPQATPPTCRVVLRVPLWGVKSVAWVFCKSQRRQLGRSPAPRRRLPAARADVSDFVLVVDARGLNLRPCLFPVIVEGGGRTVYDLTTLSMERALRGAPARYVESKFSLEELRARLGGRRGGAVRLARYQPADRVSLAEEGAEAATQPSTQPTTQPTGKTRRRARRRMVLKGARATGAARTQLVLTRRDAERLCRSPEGICALRNAQVLIVVDAAAAGTEGGLPRLPRGALAAIPPAVERWSPPRILPSHIFMLVPR